LYININDGLNRYDRTYNTFKIVKGEDEEYFDVIYDL